MKVLLAAKHPPGGHIKYGGVQSWIETVARRFSILGHETHVWGPEWGKPEGSYDIGVIANIKYSAAAALLCDRVLNVSHGVIPAEEPSGAYPIACTSEEVRDHWKLPSQIIRQPIELSNWTPFGYKPEHLVLYSYRCPDSSQFQKLADALELPFIHLKNCTETEARSMLRKAALVCASGRAALEAMACGAPTLIYDWRPYNGKTLFLQCLDDARLNNYSGRGGIEPRLQTVIQEARQVMAAGSQRKYIKRWHDADMIVCEILDACSLNTNRSKA